MSGVLAEKLCILRIKGRIQHLEHARQIDFCIFGVGMITVNQKSASRQSQQAKQSLDLQQESLPDSGLKFSNGFRGRAATGESLPEYLPQEDVVNAQHQGVGSLTNLR